MTDLIKAKAKGTQAKVLMDSWRERFDVLKQKYKDSFAASGPSDHEAREMLWCRLQVIDDVLAELTTEIVNGKIAERKLDET